MTFHQLRIFLSVADTKSFTQAAASLRMSQPDVSIQIRNLQNELGVNLFEKVGKKIYLSQAGEFLKEKGNLILSQVRETEQGLAEIKGLLRGSLYLGATTTIAMYILPKIISAFGRKYPNITIHLRTGNSGNIERMVAGMEIDIGFSVGIPIKEVQSTVFIDDEIVLVLQRKHRLAKMREVPLADLHNETFILRGPTSATWRSFEKLFKNPDARPKIQMVLDNNQAVKWAVAEGAGISLLPKHAVIAEAKAGMLVIKRIRGHSLPCPLNIVTHPQRKTLTAAQAFLELLHLRKR